jgi:hypothetical protein
VEEGEEDVEEEEHGGKSEFKSKKTWVYRSLLYRKRDFTFPMHLHHS